MLVLGSFLSLTVNKVGTFASSKAAPKKKQAYISNIIRTFMISTGPVSAPMSMKVRYNPTAPPVYSGAACSDTKAISVIEIIPAPSPSTNAKSSMNSKELAKVYRYIQRLSMTMPAKITGLRPTLGQG